jgi:AAA+ ATPase superfamily predicted ATPase
LALLEDEYRSDKPGFLVVYGRRRVGKTFLVREAFRGRLAFQHTGYAKVGTRQQLERFNTSLETWGGRAYPTAPDWFQAFDQLRDLIERQPEGRKVIFLDELPWLDTKGSDFLSALEGFWNGWAAGRADILLIACGSATSWLADKLFANKDGLYNRVTRRMELLPFTLGECEQLLVSRGVKYDRLQVLEAYLVFGGVPYYLELFQGARSVAQNVDALLFARNGTLRGEFDLLYSTLFHRPEPYMRTVRALASTARGMPRANLAQAAGLSDGGGLTAVLDGLEQCGFIRRYLPPGRRSRDALYQLVDQFTLFWLKCVEGSTNESEWTSGLGTGERHARLGYAFETACLNHVAQVKAALGIAGVATETYAWRGPSGAQIDLVLQRADGITNLCECKLAAKPFTVSADLATRLRLREAEFAEDRHAKGALHQTLITPMGLAQGSYRGDIQSVVTLDELFA